MLVSFALGDAKVWHWGSKPTPVPNVNGFASQWNIGLSLVPWVDLQVVKNTISNENVTTNKVMSWSTRGTELSVCYELLTIGYTRER